MGLRIFQAIVVFVIVAVAETPVRASCVRPVWVGTPSATVPTRGSLYIYDEAPRFKDEDDVAVRVRWIGIAGEVALARISDRVVRLDYAGRSGSDLAIERLVLSATWQLATYKLDAGWQPDLESPRVVSLWHHENHWTCSSSDTLNISVDQPVAAVRVRWKPLFGEPTEWLLPPRSGEGSETRLELGKINCGATTLPPSQLRIGGFLELTALRVDGTEVAITGLPYFVRVVTIFESLLWVLLGLLGFAMAWPRSPISV